MKQKGPWSSDQIEGFLRDSRIPVRISCNGSSGYPLLASLWFVPHGGKLWCATQSRASVVSLLAQDPRCAFEVSVEAPPYRGVRGTGAATLHADRGEAILRELIERYLGDSRPEFASTLLARAEHEVAICIEPRTIISWDYGKRMGDA